MGKGISSGLWLSGLTGICSIIALEAHLVQLERAGAVLCLAASASAGKGQRPAGFHSSDLFLVIHAC